MKIVLIWIACFWMLCSALASASEVVTFKDQKYETLKWENIKLKDFLSFKKWKNDRDEKDLYPEWENIMRERNNKEIAGRFFQCVGTCHIDHGEGFSNPKFRSAIYEGDEIQTLENSEAWIFLLDGTMVRMAPQSSITLNEFNVGKKENFISARINAGNVAWFSRQNDLLEETNDPETDVLFFPLSLYAAQPKRKTPIYSENNLSLLTEEDMSTIFQYQHLNELIKANNEWIKSKPTFTFLVLPNMTLFGYSPSVEIISLLGGKSFIKKKSSNDLGMKDAKLNDLEYQMRGFENKEIKKIEEGKWFEIDEKGRTINEDNQLSYKVLGEFITKRIPSLLVARELLMQEYSKVFFQENLNNLKLAKENGYRLWGNLQNEDGHKDDLYLRFEFLKEYYRRTETTNLVVSARFRERMIARGEKLKTMEYGSYFFKNSIEAFINYTNYSDEKENGEQLNSTLKLYWKQMHGIK